MKRANAWKARARFAGIALMVVGGLAASRAELQAQSSGGGGCQRGGGGRASRTAVGGRGSHGARIAVTGGSNGSSTTAEVKLTMSQSGPALLANIMMAFDENYDRVLNNLERAKLAAALQKRGYSETEIAAMMARLSFFERFDSDHNGRITAEEAATARTLLAGEKAATQKTAKRSGTRLQAEMLAKFDANGDGKLNMAEKLAMRKSDGNSQSLAMR